MSNQGGINRWFLRAAVLAVVALCADGVMAAEEPPAGTTLRYHFQKGDRYVLLTSSMNRDRIEKLEDHTVTTSVVETERNICWEVVEVSPQGTAEVKMWFASNEFEKYQDGRLTRKLHSADATDNDPLFLLSKVYSKNPCQFTITNRGQVTKITGVEEALDKYRNWVEKATEDREIRAALDKELEETCGEENIRSTLTDLLVPFPEGPVKKGATWDNSISRPMEGVLVTGKQQFRLDSDVAPDRLLQVSSTCTAKITPQIKNLEVELVKAEMTRQAGHDFQSGLPMRQVDRLEFDLTTYATDDGQRKPLVHVVASSRIRLSVIKGEAYDHFCNGIRLADKKQAAEAIAELDKAIALQPDCTVLYHRRGMIRESFDDYKGAIKDFDQAIKIDPEFDEGYRGRGYSRMLADDLPGALADFTELIRRQPELWRYYYLRAGIYEDQKKYDLALADLKAAMERNMDDANLYRARAVVYWKAGNQAAGDADMARFNELKSEPLTPTNR